MWKHRFSCKLSCISPSYSRCGDSYVNCHAYICPTHSGDTEFYVRYYPYFSHLHCEDICSSVSYHTYLSSHLHCGDIYFSCKLPCIFLLPALCGPSFLHKISWIMLSSALWGHILIILSVYCGDIKGLLGNIEIFVCPRTVRGHVRIIVSFFHHQVE